MTLTLATLKTRVQSVLQQQHAYLSFETNGDVEMAIRDALEHYSSDVPRIAVVDVAGDGATYDLALPSGYVQQFSSIHSIEYPAGNYPATYLEPSDWDYYQNASATVIRLLSAVPNTGETVRLRYTAMHTLDDFDSASATTIWLGHAEAFVKLVAAKCLDRLAARFLYEQESQFSIDTVDRGSRTDQARRLGRAFMEQYREVVGVQGGAASASGFLDWDVSGHGIPSYPMLTHHRRHR
jgi:hypothetical protein